MLPHPLLRYSLQPLVYERPQQFAGVKALYVHVMAANEAGRAFYSSCGFELEKEETSNQAHYRGHCLDGVEGLGRTVLLKDAFLWESFLTIIRDSAANHSIYRHSRKFFSCNLESWAVFLTAILQDACFLLVVDRKVFSVLTHFSRWPIKELKRSHTVMLSFSN